MYRSFSDFIDDVKASGKDWLKSQLKISAITFVLLLVGLIIVDQWIVPVAYLALIPFIALGIAIADAIPVIGVSTCMLPWAVIEALFVDKKAGLAIFILFVIIMIIKQILEPFVRGKSLGMSPIEEVVSAVIGYFVVGPVGFVAGPLVYIIAKKVYTKFNPDGFFAGPVQPSYFKKHDDDETIIDISDDVEDVEENDENKDER